MKKLQIKDSIAHILSAHAVSVATQFIVCSVGIGDAPQQAKLQGVYHLALLATIVFRKKDTKTVQFLFNSASSYPTSLSCDQLSHEVVSFFTDLLLILVSLRYLVYNVMVIINACKAKSVIKEG